MLLINWLNRTVRERFAKTPARRSRHPRLGAIEALEDRCLLATFTVMNTLDSGPNSLRQAITDANNTAGTDTIQFADTLTGRTIPVGNRMIITEAVIINGPSGRADGIILDGGGDQRIFQNQASASGTVINNLTITNGAETQGGGFSNFGVATLNNVVISNSSASNAAGGVFNGGSGTLTINDSEILSNVAGIGGGIGNFSSGNLTINRSTIHGNVANSTEGGGVSNQATLLINNSTISANTAATEGGGIVTGIGTANINRTTIANNVALGRFGGGGVATASGTTTFRSATIASNIALSSSATSGGGIGVAGGTVNVRQTAVVQNLNPLNPANNQIGGTTTAPVQSFIATDNTVHVGPLQDNGGPTHTMLPLSSSLRDAISFNFFPTQDQRGYPAVVDSGTGFAFPDIGAVELNPGVNNPYIVSTGPGIEGAVKVFDGSGRLQRTIVPYPGFTGGVRAVLGDVNGDGIDDIITAPGPGGGPNVLAFHGVTGEILANFNAYVAGFLGGVYVASGDFNGDGRDDIVTSPDFGGGPDVRVIDSDDFSTDLLRFNAYDPAYRGGVQVAVGTFSGNPAIVTAPGPGGGPNVRVFSGTNGTLLGNFNAYDPNFRGGAFVGTGDVNGDGVQDVITAPGPGGGPHVRVFDGTNFATPNSSPALPSIADTFPYEMGFTGGVRVSSVDINGDGFDDILAGAGPGGGPHVTLIDGRTITQNLPGERFLRDQFPVSINFTGGVFVAGSSPVREGGSPLLLDVPAATPTLGGTTPTAADVEALKTAAIAQFAQAGLDEAGLAVLESTSVSLTDLRGNLLGLATGSTVLIDSDAAGYGYFVDATPEEDLEFQTANSPALGRVDLLTVIVHELGHVLGLEHDDAGVMADRLALGVRHRVEREDLAALDTVFATNPFPELSAS